MPFEPLGASDLFSPNVHKTMNEKRRSLIYGAASEAVMQARIEVAKLLVHSADKDRVDIIIAQAQRKAGDAAILAAMAPLKDAPSIRHIVSIA